MLHLEVPEFVSVDGGSRFRALDEEQRRVEGGELVRRGLEHARTWQRVDRTFLQGVEAVA
jgi:hypothetical protein